ncbi:unnamed protein product [Lactuca virosa]|uniref:Uncharacterized protein n=1 Tax=Lactuca virosa TaxID=75947 RepID=A0AAU9NG31_9ASTR|nr:unnamed protein product [Lactuca virosa]
MEDTTTFTTVFSLKRLMDVDNRRPPLVTLTTTNPPATTVCAAVTKHLRFELNLQPRDIEKLLLTSFTVRSLLFERKFGKYANGHVAPVDSGPEK